MKLIDTITDNSGETLEIYFSEKLRNTPAMVELLKSNVEMIDRGLSGIPRLMVGDNDRVVWAQTKDGKVRCSVAFTPDPVTGTATLNLSYTEPDSRGKGIRPLLQPYFDQACLNEGAEIILSTIHVDNESSIAVALKQGYRPWSTIFYRKIPK